MQDKKFSTLIFDLDGTLLDSWPMQIEIYNQYAPKFNLPQVHPQQISELRNKSLFSLIREYRVGPIKLFRLQRIFNREKLKAVNQLHFFPGVKELLLSLSKNYRLGIVSSSHEKFIEAFLKKEHFTAFDFIIGKRNLFGKDKILIKTFKSKKIDKNRALYFGDEVRDVVACKKIDLKVAAVGWGGNSKEALLNAGADYFFGQVKELAKFFD